MAQVRGSFFKALGIVSKELTPLAIPSKDIKEICEERKQELALLKSTDRSFDPDGEIDKFVQHAIKTLTGHNEKKYYCNKYYRQFELIPANIFSNGDEIKRVNDVLADGAGDIDENTAAVQNIRPDHANTHTRGVPQFTPVVRDIYISAPQCDFTHVINAGINYLANVLPSDDCRNKFSSLYQNILADGPNNPLHINIIIQYLQEAQNRTHNNTKKGYLQKYVDLASALRDLYTIAEKCRANFSEINIDILEQRRQAFEKIKYDLSNNKKIQRNTLFLNPDTKLRITQSINTFNITCYALTNPDSGYAESKVEEKVEDNRSLIKFINMLKIHYQECEEEKKREEALNKARIDYLKKMETDIAQAEQALESEINKQTVNWITKDDILSGVIGTALINALDCYKKSVIQYGKSLFDTNKYFLKNPEICKQIEKLRARQFKFPENTSSLDLFNRVLQLRVNQALLELKQKYERITQSIRKWTDGSTIPPTGVKLLKIAIDAFESTKPSENNITERQLLHLQAHVENLSRIAKDRLSCFTRFRMCFFRTQETTELYVLLQDIQKVSLEKVMSQAQDIEQRLDRRKKPSNPVASPSCLNA